MKLEFEGILEIDADRGVVYFHDNKTGRSVLRICRLPKDKLAKMQDDDLSSIDVTVGHGAVVTHTELPSAY